MSQNDQVSEVEVRVSEERLPPGEPTVGIGEVGQQARDEESTGPGADDIGAADLGVPLPMALEAVLMVSDEPVSEMSLAQVLQQPVPQVSAALSALAAEYDATGRGFELRKVAGGWRFYSRGECAEVVERFVRDGQQARLTQAALETLAVVAYRQPVTRGRVSAVRGVNVDGVMRTLVSRGLVEEAGQEDSGALLYRTTAYFLERMGLNSVDELPDLAPFLPDLTAVDEISEAGR